MDTLRFGRALRALRRRAALSQADAGSRIGVSASTVSRIESGRVGRVRFATLHALGEIFGADVQLSVRWRGEGLDRLLDEAHSVLVDATVRLLQQLGWTVAVEVSFSIAGERGSIDVFAWHPGSACVVVIEVKSIVPDNQATLYGLDRKVRVAPILARERGWACHSVARVLVVGEGRTARRRVAAYAAMFDAALPARSRVLLRWFRQPTAPAPAGILFLEAPTSPRAARRSRPATRPHPALRSGPASSSVRPVKGRLQRDETDDDGHA